MAILDYLTAPCPKGRAGLVPRAALLLFLAVWGIRFVLSPIEQNYPGRSFMHLVNLPFHEAGHVLARPLPPVVTSLGGTLGQLAMPLICMLVLLFRTRDPFGASVALWWLGESHIDVAPYVNDAASLTMPLLGGNTGYSSPYGFHDWQLILTETGLLEHYRTIALLFHWTGSLLILLAVAWGTAVLVRGFRTAE